MASFPEAHAALLKDAALQFEFSAAAPAPQDWARWNLDLGRGGTTAVAVLVLVVVVLLVITGVRAMRGSVPGSAPVAVAGAQTRPVVAQGAARVALADADALAEAGRFVEAVHVLLACGIAAFQASSPQLVRPAYTSRDILRLPGLPAMTRAAFGEIARAVELGVFAGRPVSASGYAACRSAFVGSTLAGMAPAAAS